MMLETLAVTVVIPTLILAALLAFVRLVRGPSLPDRVIALDLMTITGIGIIAAYAVASNQPAFLDVASVLALISFLGVVAFATYIERRI